MGPCGDENLGFELIPLRMTVVMFTTILSWLKHMHVWGQQNHHIFPDHRNIPQNLKKIYQWHIISKSPKYTQTESQKYHPSIRNITDPALNWAWHPGPSGGLQADAAHANRTLWRRRKRKIQKGQGKMTYTWWAPERAKLVTIAWWTVGFMRFIANGI
jgi:hypothetical protein